ncbi:MAG: hypothetical protein S4CHLAM7_06810 [Chlamydiae bacterium]|nr:hypothetical protein [Chlamydiota bacterium]
MGVKSDFRSRIINRFIDFLKKKGYPKKKSDTNIPKKILVISTTGIGDTLWGTPALSLLKKKYPNCHLSVLTSPLGFQVLKNNPDIDECLLLKRAGLSLFYLFFKLKRKHFDTILVFHISFRWIIPFSYFLGPQKLIGFKRHAKNFAHLLSEPYEVGFRHPILQRNSLIEALGAQGNDTQVRVYLTAKEEDTASQFLKDYKLDKAPLLIGLQPGASQLFKQWPLNHFIKLAQKINSKMDAKIIIFGSKDEVLLAESIQAITPVTIASGKLSLRHTTSLISKMHLFVTNDTGPMHLALAQKIPLVSIFSPTAHDLCWPHLEAPWFRLMVKPKTCDVCIGHRCRKPFCMEQITPEEVFQKMTELHTSYLAGKFA